MIYWRLIKEGFFGLFNCDVNFLVLISSLVNKPARFKLYLDKQ